MPIYKFKCPVHGEFEELLKIGESLKECPECGEEVKKVFTTSNVHYNALGFTKNNSYGKK